MPTAILCIAFFNAGFFFGGLLAFLVAMAKRNV